MNDLKDLYDARDPDTRVRPSADRQGPGLPAEGGTKFGQQRFARIIGEDIAVWAKVADDAHIRAMR